MKTKGKYFLNEEDSIIYSSDSFEIYKLFNDIFLEDVPSGTSVPNPDYEKMPIASGPVTEFYLYDILKKELSRYENGFVYESKWYKIHGSKKKIGRWVKKPEAAKEMYEKIKSYHVKKGDWRLFNANS